MANDLLQTRLATGGCFALVLAALAYTSFSDCVLMNPYDWKPLLLATVIGGTSIVIFSQTFSTSKAFNHNSSRDSSSKLVGHKPNRPVRIWVDGCFDMMHFGHALAFRQARALGDVLVVGVNPDNEIVKYKGPPTMNEEERAVAVRACKWVDEVVENVPYVLNQEYLDYLFKELDIDYIVHGDDPCLLPDGSDVFATAKAAGRFKTVKRTEGVSTTDIIGRMLIASDSNSANSSTVKPSQDPVDVVDSSSSAFIRSSSFLLTSRRFSQFSSNRSPRADDVVVYVGGDWDMFHAGHIEFLEACRKLGTYLIVGIHPDNVVNRVYGSKLPIMSTNERALSVLSCRHVDDIVLNAPWSVTRDLLITFNVSIVCEFSDINGTSVQTTNDLGNPYTIPAEMGILKKVQIPRDLTTQHIIDRIVAQRDAYETKFKKKHASEQKYNTEKTFVESI